MNSKNIDHAMLRQSRFAPEFGRKMLEAITPERMREILPDDVARKIDKVIITGCGDSYLAGIAAKPAFDAFSGVKCEPVKNIDFTRHYRKEDLDDTTLVIGVSVSGTATRVIEAIERGNYNGCETLMVSNGPTALSMLEAKHALFCNMPALEPCAGNCSYMGTTYGLISVARRLGEAKGIIVNNLEKDFTAYYNAWEAALPELEEKCLAIAEEMVGCHHIDMIGDGTGEGLAEFGAAKFVEMGGFPCTIENAEDWCHINFFVRHIEETPTFVCVDKDSPSFGRAVETVECAVRLGHKVYVVTDACPKAFEEGATVLQVPATDIDYLKPLMMHLPFDMIATFLAELEGIPAFRAFEGSPWRAEGVNGHTKDGKIVIL